MKRHFIISLVLLGISLPSLDLKAQCIAEIKTVPENGSESMTLQFFGNAIIPTINYPCNDITLPPGWTSTPFTIGSPCINPDGSPPDNSDYYWVGARDANGKRWIESGDMNVPLGGSISFEIRYGVMDASSDCRGPNNNLQGVALEYSINGGASWQKITYYTPYSADTVFTNWNLFRYDIPGPAWSGSTRFRWYQNSSSSDDTDMWGLNNIKIDVNADVTTYSWDFGDLTGSSERNPVHLYPGYGTYNVSLSITTSGACSDTKDTVIYINSIPTIDNLVEVEVESTNQASEINLTGITDGGVGGQVLSLSAFSSNPASLSVESISYTSPATTGIITVAPDSTACGDATLTARVEYTNIKTVFFEEVFSVHVIDKSLPQIICPEDMWISILPNKCDTIINYITPVGFDNCPDAVTVQTEGLPSGSVFPTGTTTNTFVVTDASGNQVSCSFNVTITENNPPVITCPSDITASECNNNVTVPAPVVSDGCGIKSVTHNSPYGNSPSDASGLYPVGVTTITWTVEDISGNISTCQHTVDVIPNPVQPTAPDVEVYYGESAILVATPLPDHFIRWYEFSDLSDVPVEASSIDLGYLTPETYYRYASQVSTITGCEGLARPVAAIVNKAVLTVTADDKSRIYGDPNPTLTFSYSGFVFGEDASVINEEPVIITDADESSDAGNYPIYFTGGYDNNYSFNFIEGILTVEKKDQTIAFDDIPSGLRVTEEHTLVATATSGLPVVFTASDPTIVNITGNNMKVTKEGTVTITASNDGGINYNPAPEVSHLIETLPSFDNSKSLFTPNGDGINDYWHIPYIEELGRADVKVYNRLGKLVFEAKSYANNWDGTFNGNPLPEGSYYYTIESSEKGSLKGVINIVR